jgi:hypothetical protein
MMIHKPNNKINIAHMIHKPNHKIIIVHMIHKPNNKINIVHMQTHVANQTMSFLVPLEFRHKLRRHITEWVSDMGLSSFYHVSA